MRQLRSLDVYFQILSNKLDRLIFEIQHDVKKLQKIYDSLTDFKIKEETVDLEVENLLKIAKEIHESTHEPKEDPYQTFRSTLNEYHKLPYFNREKTHEKFVQNLKAHCLPTAAHLQPKLIHSLDSLSDDLSDGFPEAFQVFSELAEKYELNQTRKCMLNEKTILQEEEISENRSSFQLVASSDAGLVRADLIQTRMAEKASFVFQNALKNDEFDSNMRLRIRAAAFAFLSNSSKDFSVVYQ
jgi:translation elongation factor EF-G